MFALLPQIIRTGSIAALCAVFLEHAGEYLEIARRNINDLETDIIGSRVNVIARAPAAAGAEHHESFIGDLARQFDAEIELQIGLDRFLAVDLEAPGADIS